MSIGDNPKAILNISDDGGKTFVAQQVESIGKVGEYQTRIVFNKLGSSDNRVYELVIVEPIKIIIIGAASRLADIGSQA